MSTMASVINRSLLTSLALLCVSACTSEQRSPPAAQATEAPEALATTRQIMLGITVSTSNVVFGVANEEPSDDAAWEQVVASALSLAESTSLLRVPGRDVGAPDWHEYVDGLIAASRKAADAASRKDVEGVLQAGDSIYEYCESCHRKYLPDRAGESTSE